MLRRRGFDPQPGEGHLDQISVPDDRLVDALSSDGEESIKQVNDSDLDGYDVRELFATARAATMAEDCTPNRYTPVAAAPDALALTGRMTSHLKLLLHAILRLPTGSM